MDANDPSLLTHDIQEMH